MFRGFFLNDLNQNAFSFQNDDYYFEYYSLRITQS